MTKNTTSGGQKAGFGQVRRIIPTPDAELDPFHPLSFPFGEPRKCDMVSCFYLVGFGRGGGGGGKIAVFSAVWGGGGKTKKPSSKYLQVKALFRESCLPL